MKRSWRLRCRVCCRPLRIDRNPEPISPERTAFGTRISGHRRYLFPCVPSHNHPNGLSRCNDVSHGAPRQRGSRTIAYPVRNRREHLPEANPDRSPDQSFYSALQVSEASSDIGYAFGVETGSGGANRRFSTESPSCSSPGIDRQCMSKLSCRKSGPAFRAASRRQAVRSSASHNVKIAMDWRWRNVAAYVV
jgi:hypothetical protein